MPALTADDDLEDAARRYAAFVERYPIHRATSEDVVRVARLEPGTTVLDLACGTGVTTEVVLRSLRGAGEVIGVDLSGAMLAIAQERIESPLVRWIQCRAEAVDQHVDAPVDLVVCNSAFWLMDIGKTLEALWRLLRPHGRLVFNVPDRVLPVSTPERLRGEPSLSRMVEAVAIVFHGYAPPTHRALELNALEALLHRSGFVVDASRQCHYVMQLEADYEYLSIPLVSRGRLPGLSYATRMEILEEARRRCDARRERATTWTVFECRAAAATPAHTNA